MENILKDIKDIVVRLDDILITGRTDEQHLKNLEVVLDRLEKKGMKRAKEQNTIYVAGNRIQWIYHIKEWGKPTIQKVEAILT